MFDHGPSDRMQLRGVGDLLPPGSCICCGNGNCREGYISYGVSLEFEGELYICWFCVVQSAEILGCLIPDEAKALRDIAEATAETNATLRSSLEEANERLAVIDRIFERGSTGLKLLGSVPDSNSGEGNEGEPDATTASESDSAESTSGKERKRTVRATAGNSAGIL